ncbi:hypothetical protein K1719_003386 [Acacia pycnantha]|nr:hypothetical protein K1719_003386 [Acacia pycnantha]
MAVVRNTSVVLLSILSLMIFRASSPLPPLHTAVTLSPSDDSTTFCVSHYSSVSPSLCLTNGNNIDSRGREEVRLETSDGPDNGFPLHLVFMGFLFIALLLYGPTLMNFVFIPLTAIVIIFVLIAVLRS